MAEGKGDSKQEVDISACPIYSVVVYPDRAEVTRDVTVHLNVGTGEVVLNNLSKSLDKDSVRVDGIGPASITEVSYQELAISEEEDTKVSNSEKEIELKDKIRQTEESIRDVEQKRERMKAQESMIAEYAEKLISAGKDAKARDLLGADTIEGLFSFLGTYEKKSIDLKSANYELEYERDELMKRLAQLKNELAGIKPVTQKPNTPLKKQVIGILLSVREKSDVRLLVSYVVFNASWKPRYDLRVASALKTMQVTYFGMVQQNTGEDWNNVRLSLSTAAPSIGGSPPELDTCKLTLTNYEPSAPALQGTQASGQTEGLSSSVFAVEVPATIPADNSGHKVCISVVDLIPRFEYDTVPKLAQHAFLRAIVTNKCTYPFLAGPANVFLDQSFVTESNLKTVFPSEEFSCSLGADPSVKVLYKPVRRYREESGILFSKNVVHTYTQVTDITNTRSDNTIITFLDQVPRSHDEKLKVTLLEPNIPKQKSGAQAPNPKLNAQNNVEWRLELAPQETKAITIKYTVEYPANKEVEGL